MLGVVLFALSAGYWRGGELSARWTSERTMTALTRNLFLAALIYVAVTFPAEAALLQRLLGADLSLTAAIGATGTVLLVGPVYLASQTVPMLAELLNRDGKAGRASGTILFFSTLGSVAGGVLTPTFFFPAIGVRATTFVVSGMLACAGVLMGIGRVRSRRMALAASAALLALWALPPMQDGPKALFSLDSANQSIRVIENRLDNGRVERVLSMDGGRASGIYVDNGESSFALIREAGKALQDAGSGTVLVIGAAGFTFSRDAAQHPFVTRVDTVDVDPAVLAVAEQHFLMQPLPSKVHFFPLSARGALGRFRRDGTRYGFTLIDAYCGNGIPEELLTVEFFPAVRDVSARTAANIILDRAVQSDFAHNVLTSFRRAFGRAWIKDVKPNMESERTNFLVTDWAWAGSTEWIGSGRVYTDDLNQADRDHVNLIWRGAGE
jgi:hypothetical protein